MKTETKRRIELGEKASTTAASTGNGKWSKGFWLHVLIGLLLVALMAVVYGARHYEGPVWTPEQVEELVEAVCQEEPEEEPEPLDLSTEYRISCQANTIIAGSYGACKNHASCQLSNSEMMEMYIAGKTAVIVCKKYEMLELYKGLNTELELLKQLEEAPLDDVVEEETDPVGNLRITS